MQLLKVSPFTNPDKFNLVGHLIEGRGVVEPYLIKGFNLLSAIKLGLEFPLDGSSFRPGFFSLRFGLSLRQKELA
jgi:hypothetical protein